MDTSIVYGQCHLYESYTICEGELSECHLPQSKLLSGTKGDVQVTTHMLFS